MKEFMYAGFVIILAISILIYFGMTWYAKSCTKADELRSELMNLLVQKVGMSEEEAQYEVEKMPIDNVKSAIKELTHKKV